MEPLEILQITLAIVIGIVTLFGGGLALFARRRKDLDTLEDQHSDELAQLANTRKEIIAELRAEMAEMQRDHTAEIANLNAQIAELRGQYQAMRNFQVREVIEGVVRGVLQGLGAADIN